MMGASVTGTKHRLRGQPGQDALWYGVLPGGEALVAIADGAGSAARAREGAQIAVLAAVNAVVRRLSAHIPLNRAAWRLVVEDAFHATQEAIAAQAAMEQTPRREYAATLILLVLSNAWTVCGSVGDCAAVVADARGRLQSLCPPQRGEYVNATNFATHPQSDQWLDVQVRRGAVRSAAVFSDGLLELAMNVAHNRPFAPFFEPLFAFAGAATDGHAARDQLEAFLDSTRVNARTGDDKTLVLVHRLAADSDDDSSGSSSVHGADGAM
jgi:hypothetical protein